jgi:two-component system, NtrC family, response regulator GlrR
MVKDKKKRIVVVDDEPDFIKMIKLRLESVGYEVITASTGTEALGIIKKHKPAAVLLDILMPGMDGLEVLKTIRAQDKNLPVFMVTAFSTQERFELANQLRASGFIVKTSDMKREVENITSAIMIASGFKGEKE